MRVAASAPDSLMATVLQRITRILPYFKNGRLGIAVAGLASLLAAITEPALPALMKPLLDQGFVGGGIPLWMVPVAIIGLFTLRGLAGFTAQYALAWAANQGVQALRMRCSTTCCAPSRRCSPATRPAA